MFRRCSFLVLFVAMSLAFIGLWVHAHTTSVSADTEWRSDISATYCRTIFVTPNYYTHLMTANARTVNCDHNVTNALYGYTHIIQGVGTRSTGNVPWGGDGSVEAPGETVDEHFWESSWTSVPGPNVPEDIYTVIASCYAQGPAHSGNLNANNTDWGLITIPCAYNY